MVAGCMGQAGATTVALAIGTASQDKTRMVECCAPSVTGLAAAAYTEFGSDGGWGLGARGELTLLRRACSDSPRGAAFGDPMPPVVGDQTVTVLDVGADWVTGDGPAGWPQVALQRCEAPVLVSRATVAGLRRVETALAALHATAPVLAVLGPPVRRWPRELRHAIGDRTQTVIDANRLVGVALDADLALAGIRANPLPGPLLAAGKTLMDLVKGLNT